MLTQTTSYPHWTQVWGEESDPWPHWWKREDPDLILFRYDGPGVVGVAFSDGVPHGQRCAPWQCETGNEQYDHLTRISPSEAASILDSWKKKGEEVKPPPAELPTMESVAKALVEKWDRDIEAIAQGVRVAMTENIAAAIRLRDRQHGEGK